MLLPLFDDLDRTSVGKICIGAALLLGGIFGAGRQRPGHWPSEFAAYRWDDWAFAGVGLLMLVLGLRQWRRARQAIRECKRRQWYARAPRAICRLMLTVARADGRVNDAERAHIAALLVKRMQSGVLPADVRNWLATQWPAADPRRLARGISSLLDERERCELFGWCNDLAYADGRISDDEREVLAAIARGLRVPAQVA